MQIPLVWVTDLACGYPDTLVPEKGSSRYDKGRSEQSNSNRPQN